jgi:hypothetical protein
MATDYSNENGIVEDVLLGLGAIFLVGIGYVGYKAYRSTQAYQATMPPGSIPTNAGYDAWLQTPAGQATLV